MPREDRKAELEEARSEVRGWLGGPRSAAAVERLVRAVVAEEDAEAEQAVVERVMADDAAAREAWIALEKCVVERAQHMGAAEFDRARDAKQAYDAAVRASERARITRVFRAELRRETPPLPGESWNEWAERHLMAAVEKESGA